MQYNRPPIGLTTVDDNTPHHTLAPLLQPLLCHLRCHDTTPVPRVTLVPHHKLHPLFLTLLFDLGDKSHNPLNATVLCKLQEVPPTHHHLPTAVHTGPVGHATALVDPHLLRVECGAGHASLEADYGRLHAVVCAGGAVGAEHTEGWREAALEQLLALGGSGGRPALAVRLPHPLARVQ